MIVVQQHPHPNVNNILSAVMHAWVVKHPDLEQPPNMVAYYCLGALILNEILETKDSDPVRFENQKQLFTSVLWVNCNDAKLAALDEASAIGEMVHRFWPDASKGLDISILNGDVRFSFALVASCLQ